MAESVGKRRLTGGGGGALLELDLLCPRAMATMAMITTTMMAAATPTMLIGPGSVSNPFEKKQPA